jgi:hypothetical protein
MLNFPEGEAIRRQLSFGLYSLNSNLKGYTDTVVNLAQNRFANKSLDENGVRDAMRVLIGDVIREKRIKTVNVADWNSMRESATDLLIQCARSHSLQ